MKFYSGLPETNCGRGSTLAETTEIRELLPALFRELGVGSLVDAPCGDFNWMSQVDLGGIEYTGCDNNKENIRLARERSGARFLLTDILHELPRGDALLCREFLQHIPNEDAKKFLASLSEFGWVLITTHDNEVNYDITRNSNFRPTNLTKPPFNWPEPIKYLPDGEKRLGVWKLT